MAGCADADSWATGFPHKTLNTPYDCGIAVVRDAAALHSALGTATSYLIAAAAGGDPFQRVPEFSRRARGVPVWAAIRQLGRTGVETLVANMVGRAAELARGIAEDSGCTCGQRRGVHPSMRCVRIQPEDARGHRTPAGRRHRLDVRVAVAGAGRAAGVGEQLVYR